MMAAFLSNGTIYSFQRRQSGVYSIMRGEDHVGDITRQETGDRWAIETVGGSILSGARTLEDAKREVKGLVGDLEDSFEANK